MQRDAAAGAYVKPDKSRWPRWLWKASVKLFGRPLEMIESLAQLEKQLQVERDNGQRLESKLDHAREQRLQWQAKEATVRKELQDCQERSKDLLEQVVQLTHKQRQTKQSLLDQQFKSETTPLERNRFEMELAEFRGRVKRAEERAVRAERRVAELQVLEKKAAQAKELESQLAWLKQKSSMYNSALSAALEKVRQLEDRLPKRKSAASSRIARATTTAKISRRPYRKPGMRSE